MSSCLSSERLCNNACMRYPLIVALGRDRVVLHSASVQQRWIGCWLYQSHPNIRISPHMHGNWNDYHIGVHVRHSLYIYCFPSLSNSRSDCSSGSLRGRRQNKIQNKSLIVAIYRTNEINKQSKTHNSRRLNAWNRQNFGRPMWFGKIQAGALSVLLDNDVIISDWSILFALAINDCSSTDQEGGGINGAMTIRCKTDQQSMPNGENSEIHVRNTNSHSLRCWRALVIPLVGR
jgi:hypothetical protein